MSRYRNRICELEAELETCKRQITNERFEKERVNQELKRMRQSLLTSSTERLDSLTGGLTSITSGRLGAQADHLAEHLATPHLSADTSSFRRQYSDDVRGAASTSYTLPQRSSSVNFTLPTDPGL